MNRDGSSKSEYLLPLLVFLLLILILVISFAYDSAFRFLRILMPERRANTILVVIILLILLLPWKRLHRNLAAVHHSVTSTFSPNALAKTFQESSLWFRSRLPSGSTLSATLHFLMGTIGASLLIMAGIFLILSAAVVNSQSPYIDLAIEIVGYGAALIIGIVVLRLSVQTFAGKAISELTEMGFARMQRLDPIQNVGEMWLMLSFFLCLIIIVVESSSSSYWLMIDTKNPPEYGYIRIAIKDIDYASSTIVTNISIRDLAPAQRQVLEQFQRLSINGTEYSIEVINSDTAILKDTVTLYLVSGSQFYYPFSEYRVFFTIESPADTLANLPIFVYASSWVNRVADPDSFEHGRWFTIGYSSVLQVLSISVIFLFFGFLWAMYKATESGNLIELSVGAFAALIAVRTFLMPYQTNTLLLLDLVVVVFLYLICALFLYKHAALRGKSSVARSNE